MITDKKYFIKNTVVAIIILAFCLACFLNPETVQMAFFYAMESCYYKVIPSIFPFLVVCGVIFNSPLSKVLGLVFYPFLRLLKIDSKPACTAVLFGFIAGFAVFCTSITKCLNDKNITKTDAEILLCVGLNTGPAFIITSVGYSLLGNTQIGLFIFLALSISSLITVLLIKGIFYKTSKHTYTKKAPSQDYPPITQSIVFSVKNALTTCVNMCGFIIIFNTICFLITDFGGDYFKYTVSVLLEVTSGCINASSLDGPFRSYAVIVALSLLGLSILLQSKSMLPKDVSLKPFLLSRVIHLPCACLVFYLLCRFFPIAQQTSTVFVRTFRFGVSGSIAVALMVAAMLFECTPKKLFTNRLK